MTPRPALAELMLDRNRAAILAFELLWGVATPFVFASTVIPGYLQHLGVSNALIGLVPALHGRLLAVVQPLSAYRIPGGAGRVGRMRAIYSIAACAYAAMGLAVLGSDGTPAAEVTAIMMVTMAPARLLGPVLIGAAIDRWSYEPALLACVALIACAVVTLLRCERN